MDASTIATVVIGVLAVLGAFGAILAWFYRRGQQEQSLAGSVKELSASGDRQAQAMETLAAQVGGLRVSLETHSETLVEHHWRLKALEDRKVEIKVQ